MRIRRQLLRESPWIIYIPLWVQWTVINFTGQGSWIGPTVLRQLFSGPTTDLNVIFPVTWTCALISFLLIFFMLIKKTSLLNSLAISSASQFGAAFLFEIAFSLIAKYKFGEQVLPLANTDYVIASLSWLIMTLCGIGFWAKNRLLYIFILIFITGFLVWGIIGFPILSGFPSLFLNYITKISAFCIVTSLFVSE